MVARLRQAARRCRREIAVYRAVLADPRTPRRAKWLLAAAVAYAASPVDLIPDVVPVLGYLDDLVILPALIALASRMIPREVLAEHRAAMAAPSGRRRTRP